MQEFNVLPHTQSPLVIYYVSAAHEPIFDVLLLKSYIIQISLVLPNVPFVIWYLIQDATLHLVPCLIWLLQFLTSLVFDDLDCLEKYKAKYFTE
jgi:hypothetical protein